MKQKIIEIIPVRDAYICDCKPAETNPNGNEKVLFQGRFKECFDRSLLQWDLSQLSKDDSILKAEMQIYQVKLFLYGRKKPGNLIYFPILEPWDDSTVNSDTAPAYEEKSKIISQWPMKEGWHTVDITAIVKKWHEGILRNYGLFCHSEKTESTCVSKFISSDGIPQKNRPKLIIELK